MAARGKSSKKSKTAKSESVKDNTLRNKIIGGVLLLFTIFILLASVSYLFAWRTDQSILNSGISSFLFDFTNQTPENFMGKIGAFMAHLFIYNGLGIGSFFLYPIFFIIGFNLYFNNKFKINLLL